MITRVSHSEKAPRFKERVQAWARKLRVEPRQVRLQQMPRKWASCSARGWVTFSLDLLGQPREFQDRVIVHELLHLRGLRNHGKLFKSLIKAHLAATPPRTAAGRRGPDRGIA